MWRVLLGLLVVIAVGAEAREYFVSPNGQDSPNAGSRGSPFQTVAFAATRIVPGDTLTLLDGTYPPVELDCRMGRIPHGNEIRPLRLRADSERRAVISGNGQTPALSFIGCSHWSVEGITVLGNTAAAPRTTATGLALELTSHLRLHRVLLSRTNLNLANDSLLFLGSATATLIEDSEFYDFRGPAIRISHGSGTLVRRSYFRSRQYGGPPADSWPASISVEGATDTLVENCISEQNGQLVDVVSGTQARSSGVRVMGSISVLDYCGIRAVSDAGVNRATGILVSDLVAVGPETTVALCISNVTRVSCTNCTAIDAGNGFYFEHEVPGESAEHRLINSMAVMNRFAGVSSMTRSVHFDSMNAWGNAFDYNPSDLDAGTTFSANPGMGACKVFLPSTSPMKGAGRDGGDIGATILWRTHDGGLTDEPLWDRETGAFPCGAVFESVNGDPRISCAGVHLRLGVGSELCPFPDFYRQPDGGRDAGDRADRDGGLTPDGGLRSGYALRCGTTEASLSGPLALVMLALVLRRRVRNAEWSAASARFCAAVRDEKPFC